MKIVISPAKSLEENKSFLKVDTTLPQFLDDTKTIAKKLSTLNEKQWMDLMNISPDLARLNKQRISVLNTEQPASNARPAVFFYNGDVYQGLDAFSLQKKTINRLQKDLRILSGLYGLLRPLDLIQAYRLEMGNKLTIGKHKDLYDYWEEKITEALNSELKEGELLVNLASNEYSKTIDRKKLKTKITSPVFKDFKNGQLKVISFYAKRARGAMVRYIIDNNIQNSEDLLGFNYMGYGYSEQYTEKEDEPVFVR